MEYVSTESAIMCEDSLDDSWVEKYKFIDVIFFVDIAFAHDFILADPHASSIIPCKWRIWKMTITHVCT